MADLEFSGTAQQRAAQGESFMRRIHSDFYGNGRPGMMAITMEFINAHVATEKERERRQAERHQENSEKLDQINSRIARRSLAWTIAACLVGAASVCVAILAIVFTVKLAHISDMRTLPIFHEISRVLAEAHTADATAGHTHF